MYTCGLLFYFCYTSSVSLQQTSPSPVCPGDDVIFTCTVTASTNQSDMLFLHFYNAFDEEERAFHDPVNINSANISGTVGPFTTKLVEVRNDSIVATATIQGITSQDAACACITCKDGYGYGDGVKCVALGKKISRGYRLINLYYHIYI